MATVRRSSIAFPRQWNPTQVPAWPVEIDGSKTPRGLALSVLPIAGLRDLIGNVAPTNNGTASIVAGASGAGMQLSGGALTYAQSPPPATWSMEVLCQAKNVTTSQVACTFNDNTIGNGGTWERALSFLNNGSITLYAFGSGGVTVASGSGFFTEGALLHVCGTGDGSNLNLYINGKLQGTSSGSAYQNYGNPCYFAVGTGNSVYPTIFNGSIFLVNYATAAWSAAEVAQRAAAPFSMLRPVVRRQYYAAGSGSPFTATPSAGLIAFSGFQPAVAAAANVTPGAGSVAITGAAPTIAAGASLSPGAGAVLFSGFAPAPSAGASVTPGAGSILFAGLVPSVSSGANVNALPGAGSVVLTGLSPTVSAGVNTTPGAGLIGITGAAPTVSAAASLTAGLGTITLTGLAPAFGVSVTVSPGVGSVTLTGYAPTVSAGVSMAPGPGSIVFAGNAPSVSTGAVIAPPLQRTIYSLPGSRSITITAASRTIRS